uniref:Ig-like domain-containing protein n=1 Tax=Erpetoichthys calabaricus TaxID=27687 RepID=A0A8C4T9K4_ERPCA
MGWYGGRAVALLSLCMFFLVGFHSVLSFPSKDMKVWGFGEATMTLVCVCVYVQTVRFAWDRLPDINMLIFSSGKSNIAPGYAVRISLSGQIDKGNFSLVLKNIQKTDEGNYMCYPPQHQSEQDVKLTVKGDQNPKIILVELLRTCVAMGETSRRTTITAALFLSVLYNSGKTEISSK